MRSLRSVLTLILLVGLLAAGCDQGTGEETTVPTTTTATTTSVPRVEITPTEVAGPLVAVSAEEAWTAWSSRDGRRGVAHFVDGAWEAFDTGLPDPPSGLAVAPDGTVWLTAVGGAASFDGKWLAAAGGVFSFDGAEWTQRWDQWAQGVTVASDGTVWVGGRTRTVVLPPDEPTGAPYAATQGGWWLAPWDGESWTRVTWGLWGPEGIYVPEEPRLRSEMSMAALPSGEVWIIGERFCYEGTRQLIHNRATSGQALTVYYDGLGLRETENPQEHSLRVTVDFATVEAAPNGEVWTVFYTSGDDGGWVPRVAVLRGGVWTIYTPPFAWEPANAQGDRESGPSQMAVGPDGVAWFVTEDGLLSFDGTDWTYRSQGQMVSAVDVAPDGTVWYTDHDGAWYLDEDGPHAVGTPGVASPGEFVEGSGEYDRVLAVSAEELWAVTGDSVISRLVFGRPRESYRLAGGRVNGLAAAADGTVWAATDRGLFSFPGAHGLEDWDGSPVGGVAVGPDGTAWFGGWSEEGPGVEWPWLVRWDGGTWVGADRNTEFRPQAGRTAPMAVAPDGVVWIFGGTPVPRLARFDGTMMEEVPIGDYPAGTVDVTVITAAPNGDLWLIGATGPGPEAGQFAARFEGEGWTVYPWAHDDPNSGLATRMGQLRDLAAGADGVVWFAGDGGLASYDGAEWTVHIEGQGIRNVDVAPDGTLWYSDDRGAHTLTP